MTAASKNHALKNMYFMFRCTGARHDNCTHMRNAAMKSSKRILQAYTTGIVFEGTRYCVTGKAVVKEPEIKEFVDGLWKIKSRSAHPTGVDELEVWVSQ